MSRIHASGLGTIGAAFLYLEALKRQAMIIHFLKKVCQSLNLECMRCTSLKQFFYQHFNHQILFYNSKATLTLSYGILSRE